MSNLNNVINVQITRNTTLPTQAGFSTAMLIAYHDETATLVTTYGSLAEVGEDHATGSHVYGMARALFAQNPSLTEVKIGKLSAQVFHKLNFVPTGVAEGSVHTISANVKGGATVTATYTALDADTAADVVDELITALAALTASDTTATDNVGNFDLIVDDSEQLIEVSALTNVTVTDITDHATLEDDLVAINAYDSDFYALALSHGGPSIVADVAPWVEASNRVYHFDCFESRMVNPASETDSLFLNSVYSRTAGAPHRKIGEYLSAAFLGKLLPYDPGTVTMAYKTLAGISPDNWNATEMGAIEGKDGNHYTRLGGVNIYRYGTVGSGEFIFNIMASDWLAARIQERIYFRLLNTLKIGFTEQGMNIIQTEILAQLLIAVGRNILVNDPAPTVVMPTLASISPLDKGNGLLKNITFSATLAGAVHKVQIRGTLEL